MKRPSLYAASVFDIGGTFLRGALIRRAQGLLEHVRQDIRCSDHETLESALRAYFAAIEQPLPPRMAIGIAGPVLDDEVRMTNLNWSFSQSALKEALGLEELLVDNDAAMMACGLPGLAPEQLLHVKGQGKRRPGAPLALISPGTGLGQSGVLFDDKNDGRPIPIRSEGGHADLAGTTQRELQVIGKMAEFLEGNVSAERGAVSGTGLPNLYRAVCLLRGADPRPITAAQVTERALTNDPICQEVFDLFFSFLGIAARTLALTIGSDGGLYIGGGIVPRFVHALKASAFHARLIGKGLQAPRLEAMPVYIVMDSDQTALHGAARALGL